ncbi:hypothetical protein DGG96_14105 [Legionella qingyii]|uniref:Uncharacterized protein n=1 Tax=Legionella qingyii TaxID=2184757 RepID=A0A317TZB1_9GAMM|nr:hypothetical protein [Legionella qingyii]PWY55054.1 hypothetical protein DGG96_14105 [Legionella qingyii]RUR22674.1 hypothetical protein ELY16_14345 [Legionella qingyii]RUR26358.1 hypothetical protein ELY20_00055 [Legionella qingyii]
MSPKIYISYAITPNKELVISSYHEKVQSMINGFALIKKDGLKPGDLKKLEGELPEQYDNDDVKKKLIELLTTIKNSGDFDKVTYRGDLNLCTHKKDDLAPFLFDGTLNKFFAGKEVQLILESANTEYVEGAIKFADNIEMTGVILQTKSGSQDVLSKTYPPSNANKSSSETPVPAPETGELAQSTVNINDPLALSDALSKVGIFNTPSTEPSTTSTNETPRAGFTTKINE